MTTGDGKLVNKLPVGLCCVVFAFVVGCRSPEQPIAVVANAAVLPAEKANASPNQRSVRPKVRVWKRPLLFRIATQDKPFFVFGTIHLPDARFNVFPRELEAAYRASDAIFTEIPMDEATQIEVAPMLLLPPGQSLATLLPLRLFERISGVFVAQGLVFEPFKRFKPWALSMQLAVIDQMGELSGNEPLDGMLYQRARTDGKEVGGLETAKEQLELFDTLASSEQVELLQQTVDYREKTTAVGRNVVGDLLDAYVAGSDEEILALMREEYDPKDALSVKLMKRMLFDRNVTLTERIVSHVALAPAKTLFFAVGSGHVIGVDGIVARLQKRGFETRRLVP